jgi:hypothetical protein
MAKIVAYNATLDNVHGIAQRNKRGEVWFVDDVGGPWQQLFDRDIPRLHLHGRIAPPTPQPAPATIRRAA